VSEKCSHLCVEFKAADGVVGRRADKLAVAREDAAERRGCVCNGQPPGCDQCR
jgi:hypothetical protein